MASLTELEFEARPGEGMTGVAESVRIHNDLDDLFISGGWFGDDDAEELGAALAQHKYLKVLCLRGCSFAERGLRCIVKALKINTVLELSVEFCPFFKTKGSCAEIMSDLLRESSSSLERLHLSGTSFDEFGWIVFFNALKVNTSLKKFGIMLGDIGNASGEAIAGALVANTSLKELSLTRCNLGAPALKAITNALTINKTIKSLIINYNDIGDTGAQALADVLAVNTSLRALYATKCCIGAMGWRALANALMINSSLEGLGINDNKIGNSGAESLAKVLASTTSLKTLHVHGCGIVVAGMDVHETADVGRAWGSNLALSLNFPNFNFMLDSTNDSTAVWEEACRVRNFVLRRREQLLTFGMATIQSPNPGLGRIFEGSEDESTLRSSGEDRAACAFRFMGDDVFKLIGEAYGDYR